MLSVLLSYFQADAMAVKALKNLSCTYCCKSFKSRRLLAGHQISHTDEKPFTCPYCDKSLSNKSSLSNAPVVKSILGQKKYTWSLINKKKHMTASNVESLSREEQNLEGTL